MPSPLMAARSPAATGPGIAARETRSSPVPGRTSRAVAPPGPSTASSAPVCTSRTVSTMVDCDSTPLAVHGTRHWANQQEPATKEPIPTPTGVVVRRARGGEDGAGTRSE